MRFLVKGFILASAMLLSRAKETASKVWIVSIMLYNPDITHISDTLFRPTETAFDRTKSHKFSFTCVSKTRAFSFQRIYPSGLNRGLKEIK